MSSSKCSFCLSVEEGRKYLTSDDGSACVCSNCAMMLAQYVLQENIKKVDDLSKGEEMSDLSSNEELNELCDAISDKLMETGYLTSAIEEGDLATVSIALEGDKNSFRININVQIDDRDSDELSDDEEEAICDGLQFFIQEKQLESSFADLGFDLDENCDGYSAYIVQ